MPRAKLGFIVIGYPTNPADSLTDAVLDFQSKWAPDPSQWSAPGQPTQTLNAMGARIQLYQNCLGKLPCRFVQKNYQHSAVIMGQTKLVARDIAVPDLRAGFSYVIAALVANGTTSISNIGLIERGYENSEAKLQAIGAQISN